MAKIVPAILTDSPEGLEKMVRQAESFTPWVQIDIMDGRFVPSHSITATDIARAVPKLQWEAHLMVQEPAEYLGDFTAAGAQKVVLHYEATRHIEETIAKARGLGLQVGLAANPETPVSTLQPLLANVDSVLLLSVNPGFYGSPFIPKVLDKVAELRQLSTRMEIGMDGGIKDGNVALVAASGLDIIYVGSAIFHSPKPEESFHHLQSLAK